MLLWALAAQVSGTAQQQQQVSFELKGFKGATAAAVSVLKAVNHLSSSVPVICSVCSDAWLDAWLLQQQPTCHSAAVCCLGVPGTMDDDIVLDGLTEDDLMDDAEVDSLLRESISAAVGDSQFLHAKADAMSANIAEGCLKRLAALNKPFKYVLTCNLMQKAGAGLHAATCTRWSDKTDGKLSVQWENTTMTVLVTVYWLAI